MLKSKEYFSQRNIFYFKISSKLTYSNVKKLASAITIYSFWIERSNIMENKAIDLLATQQKSPDRALFLYIFIHEIRSSGVRASITIVHIRKF